MTWFVYAAIRGQSIQFVPIFYCCNLTSCFGHTKAHTRCVCVGGGGGCMYGGSSPWANSSVWYGAHKGTLSVVIF